MALKSRPSAKGRLGRGLLGILGKRNGEDEQGSPHRRGNGIGDGCSNGFDDGRSNVNGYGLGHGPAYGIKNGIGNGFSPGSANGTGRETAIEQELGVRLHVIDGVVTPLPPGQEPAPSQREHAQEFLRWLQADETFAGNEVPSSLLEEGLYPLFCEAAGFERHSWRQVAHELKKLPGVKCRQLDRRNTGQPSCMVYRIPRRQNASNVR